MPQCTSTEQLLLQSTHENIVEDLLFLINIQYLSFPITFMLMFSTASASHSSNSDPHAMELSRIYVQYRNQNMTDLILIRAGLKWHHLNFGRSYMSIFLPMWHKMYHYWVFYAYPHYIPHLNAGKHFFFFNYLAFSAFLQHFLWDLGKNIQISNRWLFRLGFLGIY